MAVSTGEIIRIIEHWETKRDTIKRWRVQDTDFEKKNYLAAQEAIYDECIKTLEEILAASMRCGISL